MAVASTGPQVCTSLHTDNHASTPPLSFFYRPDALPAAQPTASKHCITYTQHNYITALFRDYPGKTNLDFIEARDNEWQWHQLGRMQVCTSLHTDNHASTPPLSFFTGRMPFLPPNQQRQSTEGKNKLINT